MKTILSIILITSCMSVISAQTNYPTLGKVVKIDPALDALISPDAKIEILSSGYKWTEGPVWVKNGKYLLFSDVPANIIYRWQEGDRAAIPFLKPSGYTGLGVYSDEPGSNGLIINQKGELVACEHGDRRVSALPLTVGGKRTLADNFQGKKFNSPNDVVQHSSGAYYFTDPPYGLMKKENDPSRETDLFGVYRIGTDGKVSIVVSDLQRPNGLAFSPDEKILYVAQSDPSRAVIMAYPVNADGSVGLGKVFYDATPAVNEGLKGLPDGLKIDKKGNIFSTGPGGVLVISPNGKLLGRIDTNEPTANCAWGNDGSTLYITSNMHLCRIKTLTTGVGF
jgi:gluconolactonase